jgi:hypothetical protein
MTENTLQNLEQTPTQQQLPPAADNLSTPTQDQLPSTAKNRTPLLVGIIVILLVVIGALYYQNSQSTPTSQGSITNPQEVSTNSDQTQVGGLKMTTYTYPGDATITFKYPEGATVAVIQEPSEQDPTTKVKISYKSMTVIVNRYDGLGGMPDLYNSPYTIISGNHSTGIGRRTQVNTVFDAEETLNDYFKFNNGGQQFGGFLGPVQFSATFPTAEAAQYEPIADLMAASVHNQQLNQTYLQSKALSTATQAAYILSGVDEKGETYDIFTASFDKDEFIFDPHVTSDGKYLSYMVQLPKSTNTDLYIYDLEAKKMIASKVPASNSGSAWRSDIELIYSDRNFDSYKKFNVLTNETSDSSEVQYNNATLR